MNKKHGFSLKLEQYLLGELPAAETARLEAELKKNKPLRLELENLKAETNEYYAKYPRLIRRNPGVMRAEKSWFSRHLRVITGGAALASAAALVFVLMPRQMVEQKLISSGKQTTEEQGADNEGNVSSIRVKGSRPQLYLSVLIEGKARELSDGAVVSAGNEIAVDYRPSGFEFGAILSVDAGKSVTLHFPTDVGRSQRLGKGGRTRLPHAFRLDDTPGFEQFYFIASSQKLPLRQIMTQLAKTGHLPESISKDTAQSSIRLKKE